MQETLYLYIVIKQNEAEKREWKQNYVETSWTNETRGEVEARMIKKKQNKKHSNKIKAWKGRVRRKKDEAKSTWELFHMYKYYMIAMFINPSLIYPNDIMT